MALKKYTLNHPNKVLYPEDNLTKKDVLDYYDVVSDLLLPYIKNRPLTLLRCPDDYHHCFYQRHYYDNTPKTLKSITIDGKKNGKTIFILIISLAFLVWFKWGFWKYILGHVLLMPLNTRSG